MAGSRTRGRSGSDVVIASKRFELAGGISVFAHAGVPDGTTGAGFAARGSLCIDTTNGDLYQNKTGTTAAPVWIAR